MTKYYIIFSLCVFISSCVQTMLKKSANRQYTGLQIWINMQTILGYGIYFLMSFITVYLYRFISLSAGTLLDGLGYIFVVVLSLLFLKEKITTKQIAGIALIISGIVVYTMENGI